MKIGLTYDLRDDYLAAGYSEEETAEFDRPDTIEAVERALRVQGHCPVRIGNIQRLVQCLASGERWDLVFNIAEGLHGMAREAQVPALLEAYGIAYTFSDALTLAVTLHKGIAKQLVAALGIATPAHAVAAGPDDLADAGRLAFPVFVKPVAEGTGRGIDDASKVLSRSGLRPACERVWASCGQAALVEEYLPGAEYTVGIVGTGADAEAIGVLEVSVRSATGAETIYSYENKEFCEDRIDYRLCRDSDAAAESVAVALAAWRGLGCRDGGRVDVRTAADGRIHFLEVNPLAGLHPRHSDLPILAELCGMSYQCLLDRIMESAMLRIKRRGREAG